MAFSKLSLFSRSLQIDLSEDGLKHENLRLREKNLFKKNGWDSDGDGDEEHEDEKLQFEEAIDSNEAITV